MNNLTPACMAMKTNKIKHMTSHTMTRSPAHKNIDNGGFKKVIM